MKYALLFVLLLGSFSFCQAQDLPDFSTITINTDEDFNTSTDEAALLAAAYILSVPPSEQNTKLTNASTYLLKWMSGSPDYSFNLDMSLINLIEENKELTVVLMAAMADYQLTHKADKDDVPKVNLNTAQTVIKYALNKDNNIKPKGGLKKAIKAEQQGKLAAYLQKLNG